jgi:hypothetical protein
VKDNVNVAEVFEFVAAAHILATITSGAPPGSTVPGSPGAVTSIEEHAAAAAVANSPQNARSHGAETIKLAADEKKKKKKKSFC